jgi:metal-responsive CopG/Arc/MetJ family transcriptional regulator
MASRPVQISIDEELLERIDEDAEAREKGRSAFIRAAVEWYLSAKNGGRSKLVSCAPIRARPTSCAPRWKIS